MTRRKFLIQGAVLTAVSLLLRVTNMGYRSFLSQEMGAAGMGLYQLIFLHLMLTVTLSTSGISLAVTRMVTAAIATGKRQVVRSTVARCFGFCLSISLSIALLLFFLAKPAAAVFFGKCPGSPLPADFRGGAALHVPVHLHEGLFFWRWMNLSPQPFPT